MESKDKTLEQRIKDSLSLLETARKKAEQRVLAGKTAASESEKGRARDYVAQKYLGMSGSTYQKGIKVIKRIEEEEANGNHVLVNEIRYKLNQKKSIHGAYKLIKSYDKKPRLFPKSEKDLHEKIEYDLKSKGLNFRSYVPCSGRQTDIVGWADIITAQEVIEIKHLITRDSFFKAVGQVLLYREAINRELKAKVICTSDVVEELEELVLLAKKIGVEIVFWEES
jgi:hypothetical protein